ncbi:hypothetical protein EDF62_1542 [Leucobacter luti]|uniref:Uncharacterized protein n=1 Tax=Leucobacter luti TaxID=340320 RepID=A0A4R6S135_9MICO|nr:hypothetical protein [Leucobacter luti]TDP92336.1 hypothetical protein EDF62_1542 [Leucobacter luti]
MSVTLSTEAIIETARLLASCSGESPEYDRALVELASDLLDLSAQRADDPESVELIILGRTVRADDDYRWGVRYTDGSIRGRDTRAEAEALLSAEHGDELVRAASDLPGATWEVVR